MDINNEVFAVYKRCLPKNIFKKKNNFLMFKVYTIDTYEAKFDIFQKIYPFMG